MTTRKALGNPRRDTTKSSTGTGGNLLTGLFIGIVVGLVVAAGLAWYFYNRTPAYKTTEVDTPTQSEADGETRQKPPATKKSPAENNAKEPKPKPAPIPAPTTAPATESSTPKPRVDYTFYGILPGDDSSKQALPAPTPQPSKDIWWLQVAALKNQAEADKLKAKLTLLGLNVAMQKIDSGGIELYRIRVGPYSREDDAFGDLDTLAENNFEPRLFKDPSPPKNPEKP